MTDAPVSKPLESWSYGGDVWTDGDGRAVVVLPPFVRAHRAFVYEVTPVGTPCHATVAEEIVGDRFTIATDRPHAKVAWRVTPLRDVTSAAGRPPEE